MQENFISQQPAEAIILAGGLGTRLRSVVSELPKCMAPVAGKPFLFYVINYLRMQGIQKFIFSLGYKHEVIEAYLADQFATLDYQTTIEEEPLGTGGAIRLACQSASEEHVIVVNGDTIFKSDIKGLFREHVQHRAECSLTLKPMRQFDRYGVVELDKQNHITAFKEKQFYEEGLINGGVYAIDRKDFLSHSFPEKFSFEKEYLEAHAQQGIFYGHIDNGYFIDIGIPEDFNRAQQELKKPPLDLHAIDKNWTLFLDRDGVLNHDKVGSYIFNPDEFIFYDGVTDAFRLFAEKFGRIIITTNQRGVGRGLMTQKDLDEIHQKMTRIINEQGGKIDAIFSATAVDNKDTLRKPNPGMALLAKERFPGIDPDRAIMIGNNISDMQFGRNAGMYTVFLKTTNPGIDLPHPAIDLSFDSLAGFAKALNP